MEHQHFGGPGGHQKFVTANILGQKRANYNFFPATEPSSSIMIDRSGRGAKGNTDPWQQWINTEATFAARNKWWEGMMNIFLPQQIRSVQVFVWTDFSFKNLGPLPTRRKNWTQATKDQSTEIESSTGENFVSVSQIGVLALADTGYLAPIIRS